MPESMDELEQRRILEEIARNEENYPRDRIAAVRALQDMARRTEEELDGDLEKLLRTK